MSVFRKKGKWWIDYYVGPRRKREAVGTSKSAAARLLARRRREIKKARRARPDGSLPVLVDEIVRDFLVYSENNKKSHERDVYLGRQILCFFGGRPAEAVTPCLAEHYKRKRLADGRMPGSVNREIAFLKAAFNWAVKNRKTADNPLSRVKLLRENNIRLRYLNDEEIRRLIAKNAAVQPSPQKAPQALVALVREESVH